MNTPVPPAGRKSVAQRFIAGYEFNCGLSPVGWQRFALPLACTPMLQSRRAGRNGKPTALRLRSGQASSGGKAVFPQVECPGHGTRAEEGKSCAVPGGTQPSFSRHPRLKPWAIFFRPARRDWRIGRSALCAEHGSRAIPTNAVWRCIWVFRLARPKAARARSTDRHLSPLAKSTRLPGQSESPRSGGPKVASVVVTKIRLHLYLDIGYLNGYSGTSATRFHSFRVSRACTEPCFTEVRAQWVCRSATGQFLPADTSRPDFSDLTTAAGLDCISGCRYASAIVRRDLVLRAPIQLSKCHRNPIDANTLPANSFSHRTLRALTQTVENTPLHRLSNSNHSRTLRPKSCKQGLCKSNNFSLRGNLPCHIQLVNTS